MKKLAYGLLALTIALAALAWGGAALMRAYTDNMQARATLEMAQAVKVSSVGQSVSTLGITIMGLACVGGCGVAVFLWQRARREDRREVQAPGKWLPGPNAHWGRADQPQLPDLNQLIQIETLRALRSLGAQQNHHNQPALIVEDDDGGEDYTLPEGWY